MEATLLLVFWIADSISCLTLYSRNITNQHSTYERHFGKHNDPRLNALRLKIWNN